jgi:hypothetical protein
MTDPLSAIFKDGLFQTKKNPDRDWTIIAERAGGDLYGFTCETFAHPEIALCAIIHALAEVIACQPDNQKREKLLKCIPDAVRCCMEGIEKMESDEPYEYEGEGQEEEQEEEQEQEGEMELPDKEPVASAPLDVKMLENPNGEDEEEDEGTGDPDPDEGFPGPWMPNKGDPKVEPTRESPAKMAGFKKRPKGK